MPRPKARPGKYDYFTTIVAHSGDQKKLEKYLLSEAGGEMIYYSNNIPLRKTFEEEYDVLRTQGFIDGIVLPHYPHAVMELKDFENGLGIRYFAQFLDRPFGVLMGGLELDGFMANTPSTQWTDKEVDEFHLRDTNNMRIEDCLKDFGFHVLRTKETGVQYINMRSQAGFPTTHYTIPCIRNLSSKN